MKPMRQQFSYFIAFAIVLILLAGANYLQFYVGVNPCPLCILQRIVMGALGLIFLLGTIINFKSCARISLGLLGLLTSLLGILLSGRQAWLQHLPKNLSSNCDVSLNYMLKVLPFNEVAKKI